MIFEQNLLERLGHVCWRKNGVHPGGTFSQFKFRARELVNSSAIKKKKEKKKKEYTIEKLAFNFKERPFRIREFLFSHPFFRFNLLEFQFRKGIRNRAI